MARCFSSIIWRKDWHDTFLCGRNGRITAVIEAHRLLIIHIVRQPLCAVLDTAAA